METRVFIGIDPGLTGAVAAIHPSGAVSVFDIPTHEIEKPKKKGQKKAGKRNVYDVCGMADLLQALMAQYWFPGTVCPLIIGLEHQQPMPSNERFGKQGGLQTFSLGYGYGIWIGILGALGLPYDLCRPGQWKPNMLKGLPSGKDAARMRACQIFPTARGDLARKKDHNRGEALLLAEYVKRRHGVPTKGEEVEDDDDIAGRPF